MNRNDFLNMIEDVVPVDRQSINEVYELIDIFPYFQSAHLLLLKGLQLSSDIKFETQLRNSAIHIADREVLYYLLKSKTLPDVQHDKPRSDLPLQGEPVYDNQQTVIESAKNSDHLIREIEAGMEEHSGVILPEDENSSPDENEVFYMDPGILVPDQNDLLELDLDENGSEKVGNLIVNEENSDNKLKFSKKHLQSELIDKFIITNPRIEPNKERSYFSGEDISKPFVEEEGGFVTETLAKIYINQGYYSKAIDIYEKLCLKFPEKSSYFASQIEKVTEYIKK